MKRSIKTHAVKNNLGTLRHPGSQLPTSRPSVKYNWGNPPKPFHIGRWRILETALPTYTSVLGKFQKGSSTVFHCTASVGCWVWHSGLASCSPSQYGCTISALTFSLPDAVPCDCRVLLWANTFSTACWPVHSSPSPSTHGTISEVNITRHKE